MKQNQRKKILFISTAVPRFDQTSGDLRLYSLIKILSGSYDVTYLASKPHPDPGEESRYRSCLNDLGVEVSVGNLHLVKIMRENRYEAAIIEFYYNAISSLPKIKMLQPSCPVIIDTVDVHYLRLFLKYQVTRDIRDLEKAERTKKEELGIYQKADVVITVTDEDGRVLLDDCPNLICRTVSNIHLLVSGPNNSDQNGIIFVGGFSHEPNIDAVLFFNKDILPLIKKEIPDVKFTIVGSNPPSEIKTLSRESIYVTGYVPSTTPYLRGNYISVAPLRYGAGMKGKIGEAMAHGLPVVTTSIGAQGMGLISGKNAIIADSPEEFAGAVVKLIKDEIFHKQIAENGWEHIKNNYTDIQVGRQIRGILTETANIPIKKISFSEKAGIVWAYILNQGKKRIRR